MAFFLRTFILYLLPFTFYLLPFTLKSQNLNALFIGNSYTEQNNLPQIINQLANSQGDTLFYDSNTPGGCTFQQHCTNASMTKIKQGNWDFIVLQEQSQIPSFPIEYVQNNCFPYAKRLCDTTQKYNEWGQNLFYMTWGRKFGDQENAATNPPVGTYEGMDDLLYERYMTMANENKALVSPVGRVWRYIRDNDIDIELYQPDNSHPSYAGSYAAACSFYAVMFKKDPTLLSFFGTLTETNAKQIQEVAKLVVYDSLHIWNFTAIDEPTISKKILVFPNPADTFLQIDFAHSEFDFPMRYEIFNLQGMLIRADNLKNQSDLIQISSIPTGNYLIRIRNKNREIYCTPFVKK